MCNIPGRNKPFDIHHPATSCPKLTGQGHIVDVKKRRYSSSQVMRCPLLQQKAFWNCCSCSSFLLLSRCQTHKHTHTINSHDQMTLLWNRSQWVFEKQRSVSYYLICHIRITLLLGPGDCRWAPFCSFAMLEDHEKWLVHYPLVIVWCNLWMIQLTTHDKHQQPPGHVNRKTDQQPKNTASTSQLFDTHQLLHRILCSHHCRLLWIQDEIY